MSAMRTVHVPLGDRSYDVLVGHGARHELAQDEPHPELVDLVDHDEEHLVP